MEIVNLIATILCYVIIIGSFAWAIIKDARVITREQYDKIKADAYNEGVEDCKRMFQLGGK